MKQEIAALYVWESSSTPGKTYQTLQYVDGSMSCDCPGWTFKRKTVNNGQRTCKHVREVQAGVARRHCVKVVDYAPVVAPLIPCALRAAQVARTNQPFRNRVIVLED